MTPIAVTTALFEPTGAAQRATDLAHAGAAGVFTFEGPHDVFTPLVVAASVPELTLLTNVAIAFPRNPIHLAHAANAVSYTHLRAHETPEHLVCRLLLEKKK